MHNQLEKELLSNYQIAFERLADVAHDASPSFARGVKHISDELDRISMELREEEKLRKLKGRGPLSELKVKLGISKQYGVNLLDKVPDQEKATRDTAIKLVTDFFHSSTTHLGEGGEFKPTLENLKELPKEVSDLKPGIYRVVNRGLNQDRLAICVQVVGVNYGFVVVSLPSSTWETVVVRALNYVESEKEWVDHEHYGVVSKNALRAGFIAVLKKEGYELPTTVSPSEALVVAKEILKKTKGNVVLSKYQGYQLVIEEGATALKINKRIGDRIDRYRWSDMSATKQQQLLAMLKEHLATIG